MEFKPGRIFLLRVPEGEDLLEFVNRFAEEKGGDCQGHRLAQESYCGLLLRGN